MQNCLPTLFGLPECACIQLVLHTVPPPPPYPFSWLWHAACSLCLGSVLHTYFAADYHLFSGRSSFHKQLIMLKRILALTARVARSRLESTVWPQSVAASLPACLPPSLPTLTLDLPCIFRLFGDLFGFNFVECRNAAYNKRKLLTDLECQHSHTHTVATHSCGRHSMSR